MPVAHGDIGLRDDIVKIHSDNRSFLARHEVKPLAALSLYTVTLGVVSFAVVPTAWNRSRNLLRRKHHFMADRDYDRVNAIGAGGPF